MNRAQAEKVDVGHNGDHVTVQFRRDALGAAHPNGVPPLTGSMNGAEINVSGTLSFADETWVVIKTESRGELWIPTAGVLLLQFPTS